MSPVLSHTFVHHLDRQSFVCLLFSSCVIDQRREEDQNLAIKKTIKEMIVESETKSFDVDGER